MKVKGLVVHGQGKAGGYYGVPTANLHLENQTQNGPGVYAGEAVLKDGQRLPCVICYGAGQDAHGPKFEIHIFGWEGDLYGQTLDVEFKHRVSDIVPFEGEEQMKQKILRDLTEAKRLLGIS